MLELGRAEQVSLSRVLQIRFRRDLVVDHVDDLRRDALRCLAI
jgi:hypothetical protein